jgi:hypothetical protein
LTSCIRCPIVEVVLPLKVILQCVQNTIMNSGTIQYSIAGCILALAVAVIYAIVKLYVLSQRVDWSILIVNVIAFAAISGVLIYLTKKDKDLKEEEFFRD